MGNSPWGKIQHSELVAKGFKIVGTSGHGGAMVTETYAIAHLSGPAIKRGTAYRTGTTNYLCYEEDCDINIPLFELFNDVPSVIFPKLTKESLLKSLSMWRADYLIERGIEPDADGYKFYQQEQKQQQMRAERNPDLVISAHGSWYHKCRGGEVMVTTADGKEHFVTEESYGNRSHSDINLLSNLTLSR